MADTAAKVDAPVVASPKAKKPAAARKPAVKATHPPTAEMVNSAISTLKERGGSSLQAIKKYLAANYQTDSEKLAPFIKKYLKSSVINGSLIQVKGKGASGSFKLAVAPKKAKAPKKTGEKVVKKAKTADKKKAPKSPKKKAAAAKKSPTKKSAVEKKKAVVKVAAAAKKTGSIKVKAAPAPKEKVAKSPKKTVVKKVKSVKPKKVATAPAPKKAAAPAKKAAAKK